MPVSLFNSSTVLNPFQDIMHIRPLQIDRRDRDRNWLYFCRSLDIFRYDMVKRPDKTAEKLALMKHFWVALARNVESQTRRDATGAVVSGGWQRYDFLGMMDWYRTIFHLPGWWIETDNEVENLIIDRHHRDGVWLTAFLTSPWADRSEFNQVLGSNTEPLRDSNGRLRIKVSGLPGYPTNDHESDDACQNFLDKWMEVANRIPFSKEMNGDARCGMIWVVNLVY